MDAVGELEKAGVAACFGGGALRGVQVVFVVPLRADYADAVGEAVRELGCQGRKWGGAGYGTCV